jgi:hypothetical protein
VAVQALLWSSLALRMHEFGWRPYWATLALTAYQLFMLAPLMTCMRERGPAASAAVTVLPRETA